MRFNHCFCLKLSLPISHVYMPKSNARRGHSLQGKNCHSERSEESPRKNTKIGAIVGSPLRGAVTFRWLKGGRKGCLLFFRLLIGGFFTTFRMTGGIGTFLLSFKMTVIVNYSQAEILKVLLKILSAFLTTLKKNFLNRSFPSFLQEKKPPSVTTSQTFCK